jgi:ribosomal protein S18 acetylase RimI-like enzyme
MSESNLEANIRNYDPEHDFDGLTATLTGAGLSTEYCSKEALRRWMAIQPDSIAVATVDDEIVGTVFFQDGIFPFIYRLAVKPEFQRRGIGSILLKEAQVRAKNAGHSSVELNIAEDHPELRSYYESEGFSFRFKLIDMSKDIGL